MFTKAYNIYAKHIIHAVGPRWSDYENKDKCKKLLETTFRNVLNCAAMKLDDIESIGIPLISSGIFGVPRDACCLALYKAISDFCREQGDLKQAKSIIKRIKLVNIDNDTTNDIWKIFRKLYYKDESLSLSQKSVAPRTEKPDQNENVGQIVDNDDQNKVQTRNDQVLNEDNKKDDTKENSLKSSKTSNNEEDPYALAFDGNTE